jgi:putative ATP-dependent endonuclease of the OLD family
MTVKIIPNDKGNPAGKLADVELHFTSGPLEGLRLIGFAIWERRTGSGRNVTFPARQYSVTFTLLDEPERQSEAVITIQFTADDSLEPEWHLVNDRRDEPWPISARDRERLGVLRLSADVDRHLAWGRGSALSRATDDLSEVGRAITAANREARVAVANAPLGKLASASAKAQAAAVRAGVNVTADYCPGLEAAITSNFSAQLALHHGPIPVRVAGLATRRLNALALQLEAVQSGATLLVDEVEHGLEPFRLRHLLRHLQECAGTTGRVILTTHSTVTIEELPATSLAVVRNVAGMTQVIPITDDLQGLARSNPEALLARRVMLCEGPTEIGVCRGLRSAWESAHDDIPLSHSGTTLGNGEGSNTGTRAMQLRELGYAVAVLADSDRRLEPHAIALENLGVRVFQWEGERSIEQQIAIDLPLSDLQRMVDLAVENEGAGVMNAIGDRLNSGPPFRDGVLTAWIAAGGDQDALRAAIGKAAKKNGWFKRVDRGERLGEIVGAALERLIGKDLGEKLKALGDWAHAK